MIVYNDVYILIWGMQDNHPHSPIFNSIFAYLHLLLISMLCVESEISAKRASRKEARAQRNFIEIWYLSIQH